MLAGSTSNDGSAKASRRAAHLTSLDSARISNSGLAEARFTAHAKAWKKTRFEPFLLILWFAARDEVAGETSSIKSFELVS